MSALFPFRDIRRADAETLGKLTGAGRRTSLRGGIRLSIAEGEAVDQHIRDLEAALRVALVGPKRG